jgi:hypothetical protein
VKIFNKQLKQVKRDHLFENQSFWTALKTYLSEVILIMIHYFVQKSVDCTTYYNASRNQRKGWRNAILMDLHALDHITFDVHINSEEGQL